MKKILSLCAFLAFVAILPAQTLTIVAGTAEVTGTAKTDLYNLNDLYFIYNTSTGGFEARDVETRAQVYGAAISTVTISGLSTAAAKIAYLENTHVRSVTTGGVYNVLQPKSGLAVRYRSAQKQVELYSRFRSNKGAIWYGHIDSVKTSSSATTTNARLADLRLFVRGGTPQLLGNNTYVPTIAAGAAAGSSPTISIAGNGLSGEITLATGGSTTSTGVIATITLPVAYPNGCYVVLTPSSDVAGAAAAKVFVTTTSSTFVLNATTSALTASTSGFKWMYTVTGR